MKEIVFDIECNGINPDTIHCIIANGEEVDKTFFENLSSDSVLIGHNVVRYDIPVLERLLGIKIKAQLIDTLSLSWYLYPHLVRHGLEQWGERLGIAKPTITDWDNLTKEEYVHRCKEDVKINTKLWDTMKSKLSKIYEGDYQPLVKYLSFKMKVARLQEVSKWKLDVDKAEKLLVDLEQKDKEAIDELLSLIHI